MSIPSMPHSMAQPMPIPEQQTSAAAGFHYAGNTISWLPGWLSRQDTELIDVATRIPADDTANWICERPRLTAWPDAAAQLRRAGDRLKDIPVAQIVHAIDRVAARWCDAQWPVRLAIREKIARATGFSAAAVDRSLDLELRNYRADKLWNTLARELGDPECLDRPCSNAQLSGWTMALGPQLVLAIFTGNVPGLPALSLVRSLLVKAPVIAKVASGEPCFAAAFAASLAQELPVLGESVLVTYWDRDEQSLMAELARQADVVIAYGGIDAIRSIRRMLGPDTRLIEHGHKLSIGFLSKGYVRHKGLAAAAEAVASDAAAFNQQACIAPQACFFQGSRNEAEEFAIAVGQSLARQASDCPLGSLRSEDAARIRLLRAQQEWSGACESRREVWHDAGLEWTVLLEHRLGTPDGIGHKVLRIIPVASLEDVLEQLRPFSRYLQNIGLGCMTEKELADAAILFLKHGASRICEPGRMPQPSMMWRHDGRPCVADLVRWCDAEMHHALR